MVIDSPVRTSSASEAKDHLLLQVPLDVLKALASGDLEVARAISDQHLTQYLVSDECRKVWVRRRDQINVNPADVRWVTRLIVLKQSGEVVGRAGFHGPPDGDCMVEVGYAIDPTYRRKGHARAAFRILIDQARQDSRVRTVRATVRPDNDASRALIDQFGFQEVGEQWDEEDGLELILELPVS